jgi:hypothetical protein
VRPGHPVTPAIRRRLRYVGCQAGDIAVARATGPYRWLHVWPPDNGGLKAEPIVAPGPPNRMRMALLEIVGSDIADYSRLSSDNNCLTHFIGERRRRTSCRLLALSPVTSSAAIEERI